jgi:HK97 family phage portal protein
MLLHDETNPEMTSFILRETLMSHLLLWGNAYAQIIRSWNGQPVGLYPLLPSKMKVTRDDVGLLYIYGSSGNEIKFRRESILHIPGLGFDGLVGLSPIAMQRNNIGLSIAAEEYGAKFFANGANPSGVLEHPGVIKDIDRLRESWNNGHQGVGNSHKIAILEEGLKFNKIGIPPEDAQFLQTRRYQSNEIASIYRVPPHMIGDLEKSSFSNIEQMSLDFVKYTLNPWIIRWEQSLKQALVLPSEKSKLHIKFNLDGLLRGDYSARMNGYAVAIQNGFYSVNDVRRLEDMSLLSDEEGGNLHFVNGNVVKLKDVGAAYEKNNRAFL